MDILNITIVTSEVECYVYNVSFFNLRILTWNRYMWKIWVDKMNWCRGSSMHWYNYRDRKVRILFCLIFLIFHRFHGDFTRRSSDKRCGDDRSPQDKLSQTCPTIGELSATLHSDVLYHSLSKATTSKVHSFKIERGQLARLK